MLLVRGYLVGELVVGQRHTLIGYDIVLALEKATWRCVRTGDGGACGVRERALRVEELA